MSKFIRSIVIRLEFEGDTVVATLHPLKYGAAIRLRTITEQVKDKDDTVSFLSILREVLPEHLVSLTGLHDAAGSEVDAATVMEHAYFASLVGRLGTEWLKESSPKNLEQSA